jgi:tRNA threonylcarbamoyl adenosine modification protein (Sua5/YciO/YrdC/YwlC family)
VSTPLFDCQNPEELQAGLDAAQQALEEGRLVVLPTDTVYGIGCDAFSPTAVEGLLAAKGRSRQMPPPVLVGSVADVERLTESIPDSAALVLEAFWPGGVTVIFRARPDVSWDLGETAGTVAIRMPANDVALALLARTGPLAVSSANLTDGVPATDVHEARDQLHDRVAVYLDGGVVGDDYNGGADPGSTIVDASSLDSGGPWRVVREGVVPSGAISLVAGGRWEQ